MSTNAELARLFAEMAAALELLGANRFRAAAHARIGRLLRDLDQEVEELVAEAPATAVDRLAELPGVGKGSAEKIFEYVSTGRLVDHEDLLAKVPRGLFEILEVPGIGPGAARRMWQELGIIDLAGLVARLDSREIRALPRMGEKTLANIRRAVAFRAESARQVPLGRARPLALALADALRNAPGCRSAEVAGAVRRGRETVAELALVAAAERPDALLDTFAALPALERVDRREGTTVEAVVADHGLRLACTLCAVAPSSFGGALAWSTGPSGYREKLAERAAERGMRLGVDGLSRIADGAPLAVSEEELYAALDVSPLPPELRDSGRTKAPPDLVELGDIGAELHAHTDASDGRLSIRGLAELARARGFHTLAITDHSQSSVVAGGLSPDALRRHIDEIRAVDAELDDLTLLAGSEVDILAEGRLDYEDDLLAELDLVVASPHSALNQAPEAATARLVAAVSHPLVHILAHPTGRVVGRREGLSPDLDTLFAAAAEHRTAVEINANWRRLDLRDHHVERALEHGCTIAVNSDTHRPVDADNLVYGVLTARRAGVPRSACLNAWPADELRAWLDAGRR